MPNPKVLQIQERGEQWVLKQMPQVLVIGNIKESLRFATGIAGAAVGAVGGTLLEVILLAALCIVGHEVAVVHYYLVLLGTLVRARQALVELALEDTRGYVRQRRHAEAVHVADVAALTQQELDRLAALCPRRVVQRTVAFVCRVVE